MTSVSAWIQASRPLAQVNIAAPLLIAQAAAWHVDHMFSIRVFGALLAWGVLDTLFIVYANDYADRHTDTDTRTSVSGGSGVIVEGKIAAAQLGRAAILAAVALMSCSGLLAWWGRPWALAGGVVAIALLWAYSFRPLRMCDHAGGELLQAAGMGLGLPWLGYYAQTGVLLPPWWLLVPCLGLGFASNLLTSIPDVESDAAAGKRTWAVRHGKDNAKYVSAAFIVSAAMMAVAGTPGLAPQQQVVIALLPAVILVSTLRRRSGYDMGFVWVGATALNLVFVLWGAFMVLGGAR